MNKKNWLISFNPRAEERINHGNLMKPLSFLIFAILIFSACGPASIVSFEPAPTLSSSEGILASEDVLPEIRPNNSALTTIYENINPGVVSIIIFSDNVFAGQGSGFVIDSEGHIITNYHVIENAVEIELAFPSGYRAEGEVIGTDLDSDIAVINADIPEEELTPLPLGNSTATRVGETVIAIGNPYGLSGTMTVGIVSARGRLLDSMREAPSGFYFSAADLIQTDAAINPGNSGGPLLNMRGEVIGINRAIRTNGETSEGILSNTGIGFAVPIDIARRVVPYLIRDGSYDYPYLGIVSRENMTLAEMEVLELPRNVQGAYVLSVPEGSPADQAGVIGGSEPTAFINLQAGGDLITAVDGQSIRNFSDLLTYLVTNKSPGDALDLTILRDGQELIIPVELGKRPD